METAIVTFKPLSRGRYRCNQTKEITKNPRKVAYTYSKTQNPIFVRAKKKKREMSELLFEERKRGAPYGWA